MIRYRVDVEDVVAVECKRRGYPHADVEGMTQYDDRHFDAAAAAWQKLLDRMRYDLSAANRTLVAARRSLADAEFDLGQVAARSARVNAAHAAWRNGSETPEQSTLETVPKV